MAQFWGLMVQSGAAGSLPTKHRCSTPNPARSWSTLPHSLFSNNFHKKEKLYRFSAEHIVPLRRSSLAPER